MGEGSAFGRCPGFAAETWDKSRVEAKTLVVLITHSAFSAKDNKLDGVSTKYDRM